MKKLNHSESFSVLGFICCGATSKPSKKTGNYKVSVDKDGVKQKLESTGKQNFRRSQIGSKGKFNK